MKKLFMMIALMAIPFAMQAQTKFHDVEANEATGAVKCIKMNQMGREQVINFTKEGKMQSENMSNAKYDANGYILSNSMEMMGQSIEMKYTWENGRLKSQGNDMFTRNYNYDEKGNVKSITMNFNGQDMETPFSDYKFDAKGNWISRKTSMMGQEMEQTRTIEYYE